MSAISLDVPVSPGRIDLRPGWLRPAALAIVLLGHAGAFVLVGTRVEPEQLPSVPIELSELAPAEPAPAEPTPAVAETPPDPGPPEETPVAQEEPPPPPDPVALPPEEPPTPMPQEAPRRPLAPVKPKVAKAPRPRPVAVQGTSQAAPQAPAAPSIAPAAYGVLVSAQLQRNLAYPAGVSGAGAVGVTLTIGPSGHTQSASITSSSGNGAFDAAVRQAALAVQAPPPPGGRYTAHTTIRFRQR